MGGGAATGSFAEAGAATAPPGAELVPAANGSRVGAGEYPGASVLGPEEGDFAGWVQSPNTGHLVDPATGREFDPATGRWIDPVTGRPFGEVAEYATRLSGLGGGPGSVGSPGSVASPNQPVTLVSSLGATGLAGTGGPPGGGSSLAALYGGIMPPSVGYPGPARGQMLGQANRNLALRARVATRFALHEAAQGGRPFVPPPGAAGQAARGQGGGRGRPRERTSGIWQSRRQDPAARHQLAGARRAAPAVPPPGGALRGRPGRGEEEARRRRPTGLTEDPAVWAPARRAVDGLPAD
ncbi:hypothetical protein D7294_03830 [Streptomyces hoynatensis]|uniref:OCRE domain-containing protein n=1 Tax=Streptomyces hoynatensis TaxID=1141874 RepID=A0A3A9ZBH0_9ACTN|nr:hypothetical protein D7294_03830 [Streptomyces hoynatensis]